MRPVSQIPNLLSTARILVSPYIFFLILAHEYRQVLVWFAIAGFSDFLDGWIARRYNASSWLGTLLDPVADKLLQSGSLVSLAFAGAIPWWLAWLALGRDLLILGFAVIAMLSGLRREFAPTWLGKWSTTAQILFVLSVVSSQAGFPGGILVTPLLWVTAVLTAWSGFDYTFRSIPVLAGRED